MFLAGHIRTFAQQGSGRSGTGICATKPIPDYAGPAYAYLEADMQLALRATLGFCPVLATEPEKWLAAIVDFTFNLGAGRLQTSDGG